MAKSINFFRANWFNLSCPTRERNLAFTRLLYAIGLYVDVLLDLDRQTLRYNFGDACLLLVLCVIIMMIVKRTVSRTALVYALCPDEY
jgi:hypothetical protein